LSVYFLPPLPWKYEKLKNFSCLPWNPQKAICSENGAASIEDASAEKQRGKLPKNQEHGFGLWSKSCGKLDNTWALQLWHPGNSLFVMFSVTCRQKIHSWHILTSHSSMITKVQQGVGPRLSTQSSVLFSYT
jgi:hypothetical protein